ncbi:o-succinylbenzoate synthase [Flavobacterium silvaticum]|uniref:O-succinylbenzoate synthase n=1 Tax=Flavobacterium silvaticum TaxID=1852020 RepID=A0A972JGI7_9FLAO|nr:o-succinylbenzoate synthase [Flavobacterium silvaticum]NMH29084.1 o-succinylbenzoate synthase [Flavobacterium silvaticum]
MSASFHKYDLEFKRPAGTSRGILQTKETWFLILEENAKRGIGECGLLRGLSADDRPDYAQKLQWVCDNIHLGEQQLWDSLTDFPSIQFGVEMAFRSLKSDDSMILFPSEFTKGTDSISINGLVWMGTEDFMLEQISDKISQGFKCIKLKIGAIDFEKELGLLRFIRRNFDEETIEIRVDANGGFLATDALDKLRQLSEFKIHSIEQPIQPKQLGAMTELCLESPIPIALDEELIGISDFGEREKLLQIIKPHYLIFKPSFIGGIRGTQHWIDLCTKYGIGWWITSALESNIGLNAIAQWTYSLGVSVPQGLGTGGLYTNNIDSPLEVSNGVLQYDPKIAWGKFSF